MHQSVRNARSALFLCGAFFCFWKAAPGLLSDDGPVSPAVAEAVTVDEESRGTLSTTAIQDVRVGDRVLACNPEISHDERRERTEPDWSDWLLGTLEMPKDDGGILHIEMLRPRSWWKAGTSVLAATIPTECHPGPDASTPDATQPVAEAALQPISLAPNAVPIGLVVELNLHEMGAAGLALITDIGPCPEVADGDGRVVTATFQHPPSTTVLDVTFADDTATSPTAKEPSAPIGVTGNHLFWSVDREEFVAIGRMEPGERVLTFHGETKRLAARLPRPGPQTVYNLEVYGEHVYFAGAAAVLVHNSYVEDRARDAVLLADDVEFQTLYKGLTLQQKTRIIDDGAGYDPGDFIPHVGNKIHGADFATRSHVAGDYAYRGGGAHVVQVPRKTWNELVEQGLIVDDPNMINGGSVTIRAEAFERLNRDAKFEHLADPDTYRYYQLFGNPPHP